MERFSRRENVLLGYSPQRSFENSRSSSDAVLTNSDVDFDDVFGGPPKRASVHERRYRNNSEETVLSRSSSEKPVFGEESVTRRRYPSDDFFDDIFKGEDSSSSTPASRVLSPARPLTPRAEPFATSLPSQFSLHAKTTKAMEAPAYASASSFNTNASLSIFTGQDAPEQDELRNNVKASYRQSPLSHEFSLRSKESANATETDERDVVFKDDFKVGDVPSSPSQFHFSIYKWGGIGLPLLMPLRRRSTPKGKDKIDRSSSFNGRVDSDLSTSKVHDADSLFLNHGTSTSTESFKMESEKKDNSSSHNRVETPQMVQEAVIKKKVSEIKGQGDEGKENVVQKEHTSHANARVGKNVKNLKETRTKSSRPEANETPVQSTSFVNSEENPKRNGAKGKVKEFVGVFNQGTSSKPKISVDSTSQSSRWKGTEESVSTTTIKVDKKIHFPNLTKTQHTSVSVDENVEQSRKQYSRPESSIHRSGDNSSSLKDASSFSETRPHVSKVTIENLDDLFQDDFGIKELPNDQEKPPESSQEDDANRASDAKIQQWSNGKIGNIRSLLSTLQFVLWPGSGWKPVPLVDVIEGNAVKKAYQKALLCLHPDKLQQKGAGSDKKYIAEKVFDILQEAWDHFNSMG